MLTICAVYTYRPHHVSMSPTYLFRNKDATPQYPRADLVCTVVERHLSSKVLSPKTSCKYSGFGWASS
jgi:hypothetical protein